MAWHVRDSGGCSTGIRRSNEAYVRPKSRHQLRLQCRRLLSVFFNQNAGMGTVDVYAVQRAKCLKWRTIHSIHEFEEIRSNFTEDPFVCNKRLDKSCGSPADIEYDLSGTWVMDKPDIPKTPSGFFRELVLRKDYSKMDTRYITPDGRKLRSSVEVAAFLEENPAYKEVVSSSDFSFNVPKVMSETVPKNVGKNRLS